VDLQPDELVNTSDLPPDISLPTVLKDRVKLTPDDGKAPFSLGDLIIVTADNNDQPSDQYMFVPNQSDFPARLGGRSQTGINFYFAGGGIGRPLASLGIDVQGIHVFADAPIHSGNATRARKTAIHEIAHSFQIGEADDDCFRAIGRAGEIYSGRRHDKTIERVNGTETWSIMAEAWQNKMTISPMNGRYFSFSIEELFTITTEVEPPCIPDYYD